MKATIQKAHCPLFSEKALTVQHVRQNVVPSSDMTGKSFTASILSINVMRLRGSDGKKKTFGAAASQEDLCSHVESITLASRIIRFPRGTETIIVYCPPHLFPLNDGLSLLVLHLRGKRESQGRGKGQTQGTAAPNRVEHSARSLDLLKPRNYPGLRSAAATASGLTPRVHQPLQRLNIVHAR